MEYFILKEDDTLKDLIDILSIKAKEGVKIKLITDEFGSQFISTAKIKKYKEMGIEVRLFNKAKFPFINGSINNRNHRKIIVIDNEVSFFGGMNIGDEYGSYSSAYGYWLDSHYMFKGKEISSNLNWTFLWDWFSADGQKINELLLEYDVKVSNDKKMDKYKTFIYDDGPDSDDLVFHDSFIKMINEAELSIDISMPYPIYPGSFEKAIKGALDRGVKVKIIAPGLPDKVSPYFVSYFYLKRLHRMGAKIYRYDNVFVHTKLIIIDGKKSMFGTSNTDYRSIFLHYETNIISGEEKLVNEQKKLFTEYEDNSIELTYKWNRVTIFEKITFRFLKIISVML